MKPKLAVCRVPGGVIIKTPTGQNYRLSKHDALLFAGAVVNAAEPDTDALVEGIAFAKKSKNFLEEIAGFFEK